MIGRDRATAEEQVFHFSQELHGVPASDADVVLDIVEERQVYGVETVGSHGLAHDHILAEHDGERALLHKLRVVC